MNMYVLEWEKPSNEENIRNEVKTCEQDVLNLQAAIKELRVDSDEKNILAINLVGTIRKLYKLLDQKRCDKIDAAKHYIQAVNEIFNSQLNLLVEMDDDLCQKTQIFTTKCLELKKEDVFVLEGKDKTIQGDQASLYVQEVWDYEVEDIGLVPNDFFILDKAKVRDCIKAGLKIPGIKSYKKFRSIIRTKGE